MQARVRLVACFLSALVAIALLLPLTAPLHARGTSENGATRLPPGAESDAPEDQEGGSLAPDTEVPDTAEDASQQGSPVTPANAATSPSPSEPSSSSSGSADAAQSDTPPADAAAATPPSIAVDPIVAVVRDKLTNTAVLGKANKDDTAAAVAFYGERSGAPLWVDRSGFTAKGKAVVEEIKKANDWGLEASQFDLPTLENEPQTDALAEAEAKLTLEVLKYARYAKGGRVNPRSLSRILDVELPLKDPKLVIAEIANVEAPDAYLRELHPKHEQFQSLRKALLDARGPAPENEDPVDEALKIKLPNGKTIRPGHEHADIALLRRRLKVPAEAGAKENLLDEKLVEALKAYQAANGLKATGSLTAATRRALNREGEPKTAQKGDETTRLLINMERWRWLPDDLGSVYVWNNIPEYITRVIKGTDEIFKEKIIVGQPSWATPVFSANMQYIIFNPSWGVPNGIKVRELQPRLRSASGGFFFFGGGAGSLIRAYGFKVYRGGRLIDPDSVDWSTADIRHYSFVQPPGGKNPLGMVKFRFPNKHDIYMHDTIERPLFAQSMRALSHGCIRVQNPRRFAEVLIAEGNDLSEEEASRQAARGGSITLEHPIPVHMTYFTAMVDDTGRVRTFRDIYGHDSRLAAALTGRTLRLEPVIETSEAGDYGARPVAAGPARRKKVKQSYSGPESLAEAISGLFTN